MNASHSRRDFLGAGSLSLFGLGLPQLLAAREIAPSSNRKPAKACIILFQWGGPAHQDTWDPKPDALGFRTIIWLDSDRTCNHGLQLRPATP